MKDAMKVVPAPESVNTGVQKVKPLAKALAEALADTYRLVFKTHAYQTWRAPCSIRSTS